MVLVHLTSDVNARALHQSYGLTDVASISDPRAELYRAFQLRKATAASLLSLKMMRRSAQALKRGFRQRGVKGDAMQLPGVFVIQNGAIVGSHRASQIYEVPDLKAMAREVATFGYI